MSMSLRPLFILVLACVLGFVLKAPVLAADTSDDADTPVKEIKVAADAFTRGDPLPAWSQPLADMPDSRRHEPLVVRLAETQLHVGTEHALLVHRAEQANDAAALSSIGEYPLYFIPEYQKLRLHRLAIQRGKAMIDRTRQVNVRFLQREAGLEEGMYSGMVTAMLLVDDVRVGDILHITYSIDGQNPVFGNMYAETANWDQEEPVELRRLWLIHPFDRPIHWRQMGDFNKKQIVPEISRSRGEERVKFEERNIAGVDEEPDTPPDYFPTRFIEFSEYPDWNAVAKWATTLFPPVDQLPDELQRVVEQARQLPTPEARASATLQWVQDDIRYFSVSLGESSHRPYPPALVTERRFGDCKDKAYLLITLLHALGIEARPVLLSADSPLLPRRLLATPAVFDHVVVQARIGDAVYYLDGTRLGQHGRLDRIGPTLPGAYGLVVDPATSALTELSNPALHELTTHDLAETFTVPNFEGTGTLTATQTWYGTNAELMRIAFGRLTPEQRRKQVLGRYERRYPGITLIGEPEIADDPAQNSYALTAHYKVPKLVSEQHGTWSLHYFPGNLNGVLNVPDKVTRNFPVAQTEAPYVAHYHATVNWPDNVRAAEDPQSRKLASDFFALDSQRNFRGRIATVDIHFDMDKTRVAAADMPRLVEDMKKLDNAVSGTVSVGRDELRQTNADAPLKDVLKERMQTQVERVTTVLNGGKLNGEDLAEALCERADAEANLEQFGEARKDADQALHIAPVLARAWECHADQLAARGQFARAVEEYGKALSLGTPPGDIYYRRGRARYYAGQLERAAEDFAKARQVAQSAGDDEDAGDSLYPALWESWTLQRLHQPLPTPLVDLAHAAPDDAWPRPALQMLTGTLTPEKLLSAVASKPEDDRELTSVEAWFFVAQYRLAHDDKAGARQAFEKVRKSGITMYAEYAAAAFELKALDGTSGGKAR